MSNLDELKLELALKKDVKELISLEKICFQEDAFSKRQITYLITKAKGEFIVIRRNNKIIAYLIISKRENSKQIRIYSIAIAPEARGLGLAKRLMNYVEDVCKQESKERISLEVSKENTPAIHLYQSLGYEIVSERPNYYANGGNALLMLKRI
jgi:ribosomal-protein-alanine acetyltransferase